MIVDTGILVALADASDEHHRAAAAVFSLPEVKVVPEPVVIETDWMIQRHVGTDAEIAFLRSLTEGSFAIEAPTRADRERAASLAQQYRDAKIGYVHAVTAAIAERLGETRIATLDRRHFSLIRPAHATSFELLP